MASAGRPDAAFTCAALDGADLRRYHHRPTTGRPQPAHGTTTHSSCGGDGHTATEAPLCGATDGPHAGEERGVYPARAAAALGGGSGRRRRGGPGTPPWFFRRGRRAKAGHRGRSKGGRPLRRARADARSQRDPGASGQDGGDAPPESTGPPRADRAEARRTGGADNAFQHHRGHAPPDGLPLWGRGRDPRRGRRTPTQRQPLPPERRPRRGTRCRIGGHSAAARRRNRGPAGRAA
jgi:hypothetical protein